LHTRESGPAPSAADIERARQLANTARPGHLAVVYSSLRQLFSTPKHRPNKNHGSH
jgi:hypothetical protein